MTPKHALLPLLALTGVLLAGCGSSAGPAEGGGAAAAPAAAADGCPIAVDDLSAATSLTWKLREKREDHPLETAESIKATVCLYTAADAPQDGDPLVLRADVVTGADAATVKDNFAKTCADNGGQVAKNGTCERSGAVVEGLAGGGDRAVEVYLVNADKATAAKLTPSFPAILAAVR